MILDSFNGKMTDFSYRFLGRKKNVANFAQAQLPFNRKRGDYLPLEEEWEIQRDLHGLEITPKDSNYCYPRKVMYIDTNYL